MEFVVGEENGAVTVTIKGEFDAKSAPAVRDQLDAVIESKPGAVVVDLTFLRLIDSTGVGGIVSLFKRTREYGGAFRIRGVNGQPASIFQLLRLDRVFQQE